MTPEARLRELDEELARGRIVEARMRGDGEHVEGYIDYGSKYIYIDPRSAVVSTLLHELLHRRHPSWSEARVVREERRLSENMTPDDVGRWFRKYQKAKRTRETTKRVTNED